MIEITITVESAKEMRGYNQTNIGYKYLHSIIGSIEGLGYNQTNIGYK